MSGVVALFAPSDQLTGGGTIRIMMEGLARRGADRTEVASPEPWVTLGASGFEWESGADNGHGSLLARDGQLAVAADATLYYQQDLRRALEKAGVEPQGNSAAELILAAYRAWGESCAGRLEGDFAFIVWDGRSRSVFCARDFGGKRPLFHAVLGETLVVASTIRSILAHPRCPGDLDLTAIAADAAGLFAAGRETAYHAISRLEAGCGLAWRGGAPQITRHWDPPQARDGGDASFDLAAQELRDLLQRATAERLAKLGPTSVWLSGGWDSTAVFASGAAALAARGDNDPLHAVSISFPPRDPGREDELITAVAERWGSPIHWLSVDSIPLLDAPAERAASRDDSFAHAFEMGNRALADGSRATGSRVALDGVGGDQLFQVSDAYLSDLLLSGRWLTLGREWRSKATHGTGFRSFFRLAVQPQLPDPMLRAAALMRGGRPLRGYLERQLPAWLDSAFARRSGLAEREQQNTPTRTGWSSAAYESRWYLTHPYFPRAFASVAEMALEQGVELRSPLYDRRVIEFAMSRPRSERAEGRETKRLLRHAMRGLLPEHVLAPRPHRTGVTGAYFTRSLRKSHAAMVGSLLEAPLRLAELGIIDGTRLRVSWSEFVRRGGVELGSNLLLTLQTELWLRAHLDEARSPASADMAPAVMASLAVP